MGTAALQFEQFDSGGQRAVGVVEEPPQSNDCGENGLGVVVGGGHGDPRDGSEQNNTAKYLCRDRRMSNAICGFFRPAVNLIGRGLARPGSVG
jgi:hypothetical protein